MPIRAFVFDAYGTLYDVQSVLARVEAACPGRGALITQLWRLKQLEYTWLRTCMDAFADFETVTRESLIYALHAAGAEPAGALVGTLATAYLHLDPVPEAVVALKALEGRPRAIFSNGSAGMLDALARNSGLRSHLEHVISVDPARGMPNMKIGAGSPHPASPAAAKRSAVKNSAARAARAVVWPAS